MRRREFVKTSSGILVGVAAFAKCGVDGGSESQVAASRDDGVVVLYDTYAMALYMDGSLGPRSGIVKVDYILSGEPVEMEFWHGHNGRKHSYRLEPEHYSAIKKLDKVSIETDVVAEHSHMLFIEPDNPRWRVPGAEPIEVPLDD